MKRTELLSALDLVKPALARNDSIAGTNMFAFTGKYLVTFNDELAIKHPIPEFNIVGAIEANAFYKLISKIKKDEFEISATENQLLLSSGKLKSGLTFTNEILMPLDQISKHSKWKEAPINFCEALSFAIPCCVRDMTRPVLSCVYVKDDGAVIASDTLRITRYTISNLPVKSFLLPMSSAKIISKQNIKFIAESQNWIFFKSDVGTIYSCRTFEDTFPNVDGFLSQSGIKITFPDRMPNLIDRASILCGKDADEQKIVIKIEEKKLQIRSESEIGWLEESAKIAYSGNPISFAINPNLMKLILAQTKECEITNCALKFTGENWEHVVALYSEK